MRIRILLATILFGSTLVYQPATADEPEWLAGDFHVHTCYSHDGWCPTGDTNTGPDEPWILSGDIDERFTEASIRGLDFLAITDHNDVRGQSDPAFGSHGVVGVRGYEASLGGHAQMLGATHIFDGYGRDVAGMQSLADDLRAEGGLFQINHPTSGLTDKLDDCTETNNLDWDLGYDVVPDSIEVWNIWHAWQPPAFSSNSNDDAEAFWECFLNAGHRVTATGGSDSHWISTAAIQGPGNPSTWVFADERTNEGILAAVAAGYTSISMLPPREGGTPLLIEADEDGDGTYELMQGDTVTPGTAMRVRTLEPRAPGIVRIRASGGQYHEEVLPTGGEVTFSAPSDSGWVRASLEEITPPDGLDSCPETTYCRNRTVVAAITSAMYIV